MMNVSSLLGCLLLLLPLFSLAQDVTKAQKEIVIEEWLTIEDAHDDEIQAIEFTADGQYIVSGSKDKTIKMWSVQTGKLVRVLVDKDFSILAMAISPDGKTLAYIAGKILSSYSHWLQIKWLVLWKSMV